MTWGEREAREYAEERKIDDRLSEWKERAARNHGPVCIQHPEPRDDCRVCTWTKEAKMENGQTQALAKREPFPPAAADKIDRLAFEPHSIKEAMDTVGPMIGTRLLPKHIQSPHAAALVIWQGRELGLSAMQSIMHMYVVNGVPSMAVKLLAGMVRSSPVCERLDVLEYGPTKCVVEAQRKGGKPAQFTWTIEMAKAAGLAGKEPWRLYPQRMLSWRAMGDAIQALFSDVTLGLASREEMEDAIIDLERAPGLTEYAVPSAPPPADPLKAKLIASLDTTAVMRNVTQPIRAAAEIIAEAREANPPEPSTSTHSVVPAPAEVAATGPMEDSQTAPAPAGVEEQLLAESQATLKALGVELESVMGSRRNAMDAWRRFVPTKRGPKVLRTELEHVAAAQSLLERAKNLKASQRLWAQLGAAFESHEKRDEAVAAEIDPGALEHMLDLSLEQSRSVIRGLEKVLAQASGAATKRPTGDEPSQDDLPWDDSGKEEPGADG